MKRRLQILSVSLVLLLTLLEQLLQLDSFVKQAFKIGLLVVIPILLMMIYEQKSWKQSFHFKDVTRASVKQSLIIGVVLYGLTLFGYWLFQGIIEPSRVITGLMDGGINKENFVFAALYLSFINSFLEEFYFRGYLYQKFSVESKTVAYLVSSFLFSLYHVLVMFAIFNWIMGILAMIGLLLVGILLVFVNRTNNSIINSWIVHLFADLGVVSIGFYLFFLA